MSTVVACKKRASDASAAAGQPAAKKIAKDAVAVPAAGPQPTAAPGLVSPMTISQLPGWSYPALPLGMPYCPFPAPNPFFNPFFNPFMLSCMAASSAAAAAAAAMQPMGMMGGMPAVQGATGSTASATTLATGAAVQQQMQHSASSSASPTSACHAAPVVSVPGALPQAAPAATAFPPACGYALPPCYSPAPCAMPMMQGCPQPQLTCAMPSVSGTSSAALAPTPSASSTPSLPAMSSFDGGMVAAETHQHQAPAGASAYACYAGPHLACSPPPSAASPVSVCNGGSSASCLPAPGAGHDDHDDFATFIDSFLNTDDIHLAAPCPAGAGPQLLEQQSSGLLLPPPAGAGANAGADCTADLMLFPDGLLDYGASVSGPAAGAGCAAADGGLGRSDSLLSLLGCDFGNEC